MKMITFMSAVQKILQILLFCAFGAIILFWAFDYLEAKRRVKELEFQVSQAQVDVDQTIGAAQYYIDTFDAKIRKAVAERTSDINTLLSGGPYHDPHFKFVIPVFDGFREIYETNDAGLKVLKRDPPAKKPASAPSDESTIVQNH